LIKAIGSQSAEMTRMFASLQHTKRV